MAESLQPDAMRVSHTGWSASGSDVSPKRGARAVRFTVFDCRVYNGFSGTEVLAPGLG
ncbi:MULTISPECIES: hypothetical protein [Lysobacter]|uniref:hypothetical protein n=1 Tax=Lysobacter TaxID=68 RepID=UPI001F16582E|nr:MULTISPECIES: hypothetical protein [Lysobacter]UJB21441.1 hypothetical protein L1A79_10485 [Lysobacter capsici]UJQ29442.1 hypothetical protein L2D09_04380 [Lysobacter gummosus]